MNVVLLTTVLLCRIGLLCLWALNVGLRRRPPMAGREQQITAAHAMETARTTRALGAEWAASYNRGVTRRFIAVTTRVALRSELAHSGCP